MALSVFMFKILRFFQDIIDFLKDTLKRLFLFFSFLKKHPKAEEAKIKIKKTGKRILKNIKENRENWSKRTFDNHGFIINKEDI